MELTKADLFGFIPDERGTHTSTSLEELRLLICDVPIMRATAQQFLNKVTLAILRRLDVGLLRSASVTTMIPEAIYSNVFMRHLDNEQIKVIWRPEKQLRIGDPSSIQPQSTRLESYLSMQQCFNIFGHILVGELVRKDPRGDPYYFTILFGDKDFKINYVIETGKLTIKFNYIVYRRYDGGLIDII